MSASQVLIAGRYRLIRSLGNGGMGRVWLARDQVLHRDVAVKEVVLPVGLTDAELEELRQRTLREARAAARLSHPNVVQIYDVVRTDDQPWIVMEYVPSRSLHRVIEEDGPLPPARVARIGLSVLAALDAAHRAGVLHRDVKPSNVLISDAGRVVLTDFGLATFDGGENAVTRPGLVLGSPQYVSPERARDGDSTPEADLWSLGATLYAAVEGRSPFARPTTMATLTALATERPDPMRRAGPLKPVLLGLLRRNVRSRLGVAEAESLLWRAAEPGTRTLGRRLPRPRPPREPGRWANAPQPATARPAVWAAPPALPSAAPAMPAGPTTPSRAPAVAPAMPAGPTTPSRAPADGDTPAGARTAAAVHPGVDAPTPRLAVGAATTRILSTTPPVPPARQPTTPDPTAPNQTAPGQTTPGQTAPGQTAPHPAAPQPAVGRATVTEPHRLARPPRHRLWLAGSVVGALLVVLGLTLPREPSGAVGTQGRPVTGTTPSPGSPAPTPIGGLGGPGGPGSPVAALRATGPAVLDGYGLPDGWVWHQDPAGFRIAVPRLWGITTDNSLTYLREPGGDRMLAVGRWQPAVRDPVGAWQREEADTAKAPGYQRLRMEAVACPFAACAEWEYAYDAAEGVRLQVVNRGLRTAAGREYVILWRTRAFDWQVNQPYFRLIITSFHPAP
jgi:serine/threonine protein kinase